MATKSCVTILPLNIYYKIDDLIKNFYFRMYKLDNDVFIIRYSEGYENKRNDTIIYEADEIEGLVHFLTDKIKIIYLDCEKNNKQI